MCFCVCVCVCVCLNLLLLYGSLLINHKGFQNCKPCSQKIMTHVHTKNNKSTKTDNITCSTACSCNAHMNGPVISLCEWTIPWCSEGSISSAHRGRIPWHTEQNIHCKQRKNFYCKQRTKSIVYRERLYSIVYGVEGIFWRPNSGVHKNTALIDMFPQ